MSANAIKLLFAAVFLVAIPAMVHALFEGLYVVTSDGRPVSYHYVTLPPGSAAKGAYVAGPDQGRRWYWIGPISNTLPFAFLTLLFLAHCGRLKSRSLRSAYCGAVAAWSSMMGFSVYIILHYRSSHLPSTTGIAVMLTPFCYIPFLVLPYIVGAIVGRLWTKWRDKSCPNSM
jgi:hypothetical protein